MNTNLPLKATGDKPGGTPSPGGFWAKLGRALFGGCCSCHESRTPDPRKIHAETKTPTPTEGDPQ
jgi:hypothetical protein